MPSSIPMDSSILPFDTKHVSKVLPVSPQNRWLIEPLWFKSGVGILGGHAKVCKTQLAAEIAIAVASGHDELQPTLLILDPLVRIARLDENSAADVSGLLGSLRAMQRDFDLALLLVHHARKSKAQNPGQALRGSSDISAWSDTNLYLSRNDQLLTLQIEHRFAAPPMPLHLKLDDDPAIHLSIINYDSFDSSDSNPQSLHPLQQQLLNLLSAHRPLSTVALRSLLHRRKQHVVLALNQLLELNLVQRGPDGWSRSS